MVYVRAFWYYIVYLRAFWYYTVYLSAFWNINDTIAPKLLGLDPTKQTDIDKLMVRACRGGAGECPFLYFFVVVW